LQAEEHVRHELETQGKTSPSLYILNKRASVAPLFLVYRIFDINSAPGLSPSFPVGLRNSVQDTKGKVVQDAKNLEGLFF
ncbi:MAG: hypothetical protein PVG26_05770, partial [Desulfobacterales bacterium]